MSFSTTLSTWYLSHIVHKNTGNEESMTAEIYLKLLEEETNFQKKKKRLDWKVMNEFKRDYLFKKGKTFNLDLKWMTFWFKKFKAERGIEVDVQSILRSVIMSLTESMTTSTSTECTLMSAKEISAAMLDLNGKHDHQGDSFTNILKLVKNLKFNTLVDFSLSSPNQNLRATFSSFAKRQVGGPREIFIMEIELRILVKLLEAIFKTFNKKMEVEMLTSEDKVSRMRNISLSHDELRRREKKGLTFHVNADVTRWNQNWTAHKTSLAILALELPRSLEDRLLSLSSSFSLKFVTLNSSLLQKYKRMEEKKAKFGKDLTAIVKNTHLGTMTILCQSAFFQGILHYMSSFCAVVKDYVSDQILIQLLRESNISEKLLLTDTMLSSDDITKIATFKVNLKSEVKKYGTLLMLSLDVAGSIMDEIISRMKTSVHVLLFEF